jgi:hypothetical protein
LSVAEFVPLAEADWAFVRGQLAEADWAFVRGQLAEADWAFVRGDALGAVY